METAASATCDERQKTSKKLLRTHAGVDAGAQIQGMRGCRKTPPIR